MTTGATPPAPAETLNDSPPSVYTAIPSATPYTIGDVSSTSRDSERPGDVRPPPAHGRHSSSPVDRELRRARPVHAAVLHELKTITPSTEPDACRRLRKRRDVRRFRRDLPRNRIPLHRHPVDDRPTLTTTRPEHDHIILRIEIRIFRDILRADVRVRNLSRVERIAPPAFRLRALPGMHDRYPRRAHGMQLHTRARRQPQPLTRARAASRSDGQRPHDPRAARVLRAAFIERLLGAWMSAFELVAQRRGRRRSR